MSSSTGRSHHWLMAIGLPYPAYIRKLMVRAAGLWLLVRCLHAFVVVVNVQPQSEATAIVLHPGGVSRVVLVAVAAFLVWWDRKRASELLIQANLGAHPAWFWSASAIAAATADAVVQTIIDWL